MDLRPASTDKEHLQKQQLLQKNFYKALKLNNVDDASQYIKKGALCHVPVERELFPLHLSNGNLQEAGRQIRMGARVNELIDKDLYPLHIAAGCGHMAMVAMLVDCGADVNAKTSSTGETVLGLAAAGGYLGIINVLREKGRDKGTFNIHASNKLGQNAVYVAAQHGYGSVVSTLICAGVAKDAPAVDGSTAIFAAAVWGHQHVVRALVNDHGVDINARVPGDGYTALYRAAGLGRADAVRLLMFEGANPGLSGPGSHTPAYIAAQHGFVDVLVALGEAKDRKNAMLDVAVHDGVTPLCIAADKGHTEAVRALAGLGARVDVAALSDGYTPLCMAAQRGHVRVVECLLELGANGTARTNDNATPMYIAAQFGHTDVIRALARRGISLDAPATNGGTPALIAGIKGHVGVIRLLYKLGADMSAYRAHPDYVHDSAVDCIVKILTKMEHECEHCGCDSKRLAVCGRCQKVRYCSRECQVADHKRHRQECVQPGVQVTFAVKKQRVGELGGTL